jgi:hypothetical protein
MLQILQIQNQLLAVSYWLLAPYKGDWQFANKTLAMVAKMASFRRMARLKMLQMGWWMSVAKIANQYP